MASVVATEKGGPFEIGCGSLHLDLYGSSLVGRLSNLASDAFFDVCVQSAVLAEGTTKLSSLGTDCKNLRQAL